MKFAGISRSTLSVSGVRVSASVVDVEPVKTPKSETKDFLLMEVDRPLRYLDVYVVRSPVRPHVWISGWMTISSMKDQLNRFLKNQFYLYLLARVLFSLKKTYALREAIFNTKLKSLCENVRFSLGGDSATAVSATRSFLKE